MKSRPALWIKAEPARFWLHRGIWCAVLTHPMRAGFNGYVWIPPGHPYRDFSHFDDMPVEVHGGLTFGPYQSPEVTMGDITLPAQERTWQQSNWWIGFDTLHGGDIAMPLSYEDGLPTMVSTWTEEQVAAETEYLAAQVADAWEPGA